MPQQPGGNRPWVFLDIGNVIFYDLPLLARIWRHFYLTLKAGGFKMAYPEVLKERERILSCSRPEDNPRRAIARQHAGDLDPELVDRAVNRWLEVYPGANFPVRGIKPALEVLATKYRLGIIANQPPLARQELARHGLDSQFDPVIISDEVGFHKPDMKIFRHALELAGADPQTSLMVGDRIDNDIRPARMAGMRTVWLDLDLRYMDYQPEDEYERLYMESYHRVTGIDRDTSDPASRPDAMAREAGELPLAVAGVISQMEVAG